jgi:hypothetical protein
LAGGKEGGEDSLFLSKEGGVVTDEQSSYRSGFPSGAAAPLTGPVGESLRGPSFVGLEAAPRDLPMVLAGVARLLGTNRRIYCADGCNRFDPYRFSQWARSMGMDPTAVLSRVYLSRAFTIHQMAALATEELPRLSIDPEPPLVVFLGIETLFLDEQVPHFEREHLFRRTLGALTNLRRRGFSLLATVSPEDRSDVRGVPSGRLWRQLLTRSADVMTRLRSFGGGAFLFEGSRRPLDKQGASDRKLLHDIQV